MTILFDTPDMCAKIATVLTLALCTIAANAANLGFLSDTPISYMKERDLKVLNKSVGIALNTKADRESLAWSNDGTGNPVEIRGTITPSNTVKDEATTCRTVTIVAQAKGQTQTWSPVACQAAREKWRLKKQ
jgi:hypothetical protein